MSELSLPGKRPAAELLYENLTAVLNSFDICALPRVMLAPVLFLFHWRRETEKNTVIMNAAENYPCSDLFLSDLVTEH